MKAFVNTLKETSLEEVLFFELDNIYYPGYAAELAASDPSKLQWEFAEFKGQFSC